MLMMISFENCNKFQLCNSWYLYGLLKQQMDFMQQKLVQSPESGLGMKLAAKCFFFFLLCCTTDVLIMESLVRVSCVYGRSRIVWQQRNVAKSRLWSESAQFNRHPTNRIGPNIIMKFILLIRIRTWSQSMIHSLVYNVYIWLNFWCVHSIYHLRPPECGILSQDEYVKRHGLRMYIFCWLCV